MSISTVDHELPDESHNLYDVSFFGEEIHTLVTSDPSMVEAWISETLRLSPSRPLLVGLDVEWRPNTRSSDDNPVATLQLCSLRRCLILQLLYAPSLPPSLSAFLAHPDHHFLGVGVAADAEKLLCDHNLRVAHPLDLRPMAAAALARPDLRNAGLKTLASQVLGKHVDKPSRVSRSRWDSQWLSVTQVQYACLDAFLSYEIGTTLCASISANANA